MKMSKAAEGFIFSMRAGTYSPVTIRNYKLILDRFVLPVWGEREVNEITKQNVIDYLASQKDRGVSNATVQIHWKVLRSFFRWAAGEFGIVRPDLEVKAPKFANKHIEALSRETVEKMMKAARSLRNKAILLLLLDTGLRVSELCRVALRDCDQDTGMIQIRAYQTGAKSRPRVVYMGAATRAAVWRYIASRDNLRPEDPLIATIKGGPLNRLSVANIIDRIGEAAGVGPVNPHRFRHTMAIEYLRSGGDIFTLQRILGHSSLEMVRRYLDICQDDVRDAFRKSSPVDRWHL